MNRHGQEQIKNIRAPGFLHVAVTRLQPAVLEVYTFGSPRNLLTYLLTPRDAASSEAVLSSKRH